MLGLFAGDRAGARLPGRTGAGGHSSRGALRQGPAEDPSSQIAAVIDESQFNKIMSYVEVGQREGRLVVGGEPDGADGWYIQPTVFADVPEDGRLAQEEIFGPLLSVIRARDYNHALAIANDTEYGLTGGVYSRDRRHLEQARAEISGRQPLPIARNHRRHGRRPPLRRLQHVGHRFESRAP